MRGPAPILLAAALLAAVAAPGCGRLPRIIVLGDPLTPAEHVDLGVAYERKGELDLAVREYERAIRKDGRFFQARVNLGNVHAARGRYKEARRQYLKALAIRPKDPEATNNLAWAAVLSGEGVGDALERLEEVTGGPAGRDPRILDTLGVLRMRAGKPEGAEEALGRAELLCLDAAPVPGGGEPRGPGGTPGPDCPEETLREIRAHRRELAERFPAPAPAAPLVR